jgi:GNAT superfamily N-acetyltransferase
MSEKGSSNEIRPATLEDSDEMAVLLSQLGYPADAVSVRRRLEVILARADYRVMVAAERDEKLAGMVSACWGLYLEHDGRWGRVIALVVSERMQNQGLGRRLLAEAESWLRSSGAIASIINSSQRRAGAHRFYERRGYRATGIRFEKPLGPARGATPPPQSSRAGLSESRMTGAPASTRH